jgi:integrase
MTADAIAAAATKSRHSVRRFRITAQLARKLWASLTTKPDEARLFAEVDNRSTAYWTIRYAGERAGIPFPVGNHSFRHTAASMMARAVMRQDGIRDAIGNHSYDFTRSVYVHRYEDDVPDPTGALGHLTTGGETRLRAVAGEE